MTLRSNFAITRLILLPYGTLLLLYILLIGGGGWWLYAQVRSVEAEILVRGVMAEIEPLAEKLSGTDAFSSLEQRNAWLVTDIEQLFEDIPSLRNVSVRSSQAGYQMRAGAERQVSTRAVAPLPAIIAPAYPQESAAQRLISESGELFLINFDLHQEDRSIQQLEFPFERAMMLTTLEKGLGTIKRAVIVLGSAGALGIFLALGVTLLAMRTTRKLEAHFQDLYQRASITELSAQLVHDLRNPLASLRANARAILISPQQTSEIVQELDRDIVSLNQKLTDFLSLTRSHDQSIELVAADEVVTDAARLAMPAMEKRGLKLELDIPPNIPPVPLQRSSMIDALLNIMINAAESGQREGAVWVRVKVRPPDLEISVEDSGPGISSQDLPKLFDSFFTTRTEGNGLGLAIVKRIVAAHHGTVYAENRPEGGARVVLVLPLKPKEPPLWWSKLKKHSPI